MEPTARAVALVGAETVSCAEIFYTGNGRSGREGSWKIFGIIGTTNKRDERNRGPSSFATV